MTIRLDVKSNLTEVRKLFAELGPGVDRAASRALNDAMRTVRAEGARAIKREHSAMRIGDIKKSMKVDKATARKLSTSVEATGRPLSLLSFRATQTRKGVKATIGTKRVLVSYHGRKAFIIPKFGGEVFVRRFAKGRQIRRFRGPSLPGVFRARVLEFKRIAVERWNKTFPNRLQFEIEKAQRKARSA